ncbi:MAG: pyrimidine utilization protein D [Zavarzinia sp.]|nr:pyrimidine utilization protein D [Zavarzinia sp.]
MSRTGVADGIHWELHGRDDGPAVLFASGLGGGAGFWRPQIAAFAGRYRVVLYDHRGTGRSGRTLPDDWAGVASLARDALCVADHLGLERFDVVGHAAGGLAGLWLARHHAARIGRLVVVNGWGAPDRHIARCFEARLALLRLAGPLAYVRAQALFLYPPDWISAHDDLLAASEAALAAELPDVPVMERRIRALLDFDMSGALGAIATPSLIMASRDDMLVPPACAAHLARTLPQASLHITPWGGHGFCHIAPGPFNAAVQAFLSA